MKAIIQKVKQLSISQSNEKAYKELYQRTRTKHKNSTLNGSNNILYSLIKKLYWPSLHINIKLFLFLQGKKGKKGKKGKVR